MNRPPQSSTDPLHAPLWRKLLALRVLLLCAAGLFLSFALIDWSDKAKQSTPGWLEFVILGVAGFQLIAFIYVVHGGIVDLIVHFLTDGRFKRLILVFLMVGDRSPEVIANEFNSAAYTVALLPFIIGVGLAVLALAVALFIGGVALVVTLFSAIFSGWPVWAVVITILLVAILFKK